MDSVTAKQTGKLTSRRNLLAGAAVFGAFAASNGVGASSAKAWGLFPSRKPDSGWGSGGGGHCYLEGTLIATPDGERCIESLAIGDLVTTASGAARPVKWIGRWIAEQGRDRQYVPVKVSRGALDGTAPHTDLYVSDQHCMFIDGVLIPAIDLVNGISITKEAPSAIDALRYFHVELEDHDIIVANGAQSESLRVAAGDRQRFENGEEYLGLYDYEPVNMAACAPIIGNTTRMKELQSRFRTAIAPLYDVRHPHEVVRARLADQATRLAA